MTDVLKKWWTEHGTKILGYATAAVGILEYLDEQTIKAIEFVAGPKAGPIISHGLVAISGLLTAKRGFTNSAKKAEQSSESH